MLKTRAELKELVAKLDAARRDATGPGCGCYCAAPIVIDGETFRWEPKPAMRIGAKLKADGTTPVEKMQNGKPGIRIPLGCHGRSFLAIDVDTGQVFCSACAGKKGGAP